MGDITAAMGEHRQVSPISKQRILDALGDVLAESTRRAYRRHWSRFEEYCHVSGYRALPADVDVVCEFLHVLEHSTPAGRSEGSYKVSTIDQAAAAIKYVHRSTVATPEPVAGKQTPALWEHPQLLDFMRAMRNRAARQGTSEPSQEEPLLLEELVACITAARDQADTWRKRLHERRDTAVLLLGWSCALRRSELTSLTVRDIKHGYRGWTMTLRRSKTDQAGRTYVKAMPTGENLATCGPCAFVRWMEVVTTYDELGRVGLIRLLARGDRHDHHVCGHRRTWPKPKSPLFRRVTVTGDIDPRAMSDEMVGTILRRRLDASGLGVNVDDYGAHSLRAGLVTEAFLQGQDLRAVMRQSGHRSTEGLMRYARERDAFDNNAVTALGL